MRSGVCSVQQALTAEAANLVKQAVGLARRRGHAQVTPLHVASAMLASSTSLLRRACLQSHSHPLQFRALELCFNVALNRLPASTSSPLLGPHTSHHHPSLSNALVAAFKRAQAHQRRGSIENQQQPILALKIELEHLIISILDDPSVSRVMREAGFSSTQVKNKVEQTVSLEICCTTTSQTTSKDNTKPQPLVPNAVSHSLSFHNQVRFGLPQDINNVLNTVLNKRKNTVIIGESLGSAESVVRGVMDKFEKGQVSGDLRYVQFISLPLFSLRNLPKEEVEQKLVELKCLVKNYMGRGVILYLVDHSLSLSLNLDSESQPQHRSNKASIEWKSWVLGEGAGLSQDSVSVKDLYKKWNSFGSSASSEEEAVKTDNIMSFESKRSPKEHQFWISDDVPKPDLLSNPNSSPNSASSSEAMEEDMDGLNEFKVVNAENLSILCNALEKKVPWHKDMIPEIATTILECRSGLRKLKSSLSLFKHRERQETWLFFLGSDCEAKHKIARELARLIFGSQTNFVSISLSNFESNNNNNNKRKRDESSGSSSYVQRLAEALNENPHRVLFMEDLDQLDYSSHQAIKQAIESGKVTLSDGETVPLKDAIIIFTCDSETFTSVSRKGTQEMEEKKTTSSVSLDLNIAIEDHNCEDGIENSGIIRDMGILEYVDNQIIFRVQQL
ncbi:hypothetical protein COLO4_32913 [Corchorus olitorius]|uniref:Clp R domain-containing protein n=1 Tax=Corchorus olitorius TaxID=93759 RepID=A0A1R3GXF1_9ROSI|nr:hypothetical protein COLO4_32913 [Corchorus olitorius]